VPDVTLKDSMGRLEEAETDRVNFDTHWDQVAQLCLPTREFLRDQVPQGEQRRLKIYDETAPNAVDTLSAAIHFLLTNPGDRWVVLAPEDPNLLDDEETLGWYHDSTSRLLLYFAAPASGFPTASHEVYLDLSAFGSGSCRAGPARRGRLRFVAKPLAGTYYLDDEEAETSDVLICTMERVRDIVRMFENVSDQLARAAMDPKGGEERVRLAHHVWRRLERDPTSDANFNMPWGSRHFIKGGTVGNDQELDFGGFRENPYLTPRWMKAANETYGRGPAMTVLPAIQSINAMARDQLVAGSLRTRPPVNVWDASLKNRKLELFPGGVNYMKQTVPASQQPQAMDTGADPNMGEAAIERKARKIERAFFLDTIELPLVDKSHSQMTEKEVIFRRQTALAKASPIVSRLTAEWLVPAVGMVVRWMLRSGLFRPVPRRLAGTGVRAIFTSPMAQSQRQREAQLILEGVRAAGVVATIDPRATLNVDPDASLRKVWNQIGADPTALRSLEAVRRLRQQLDEQNELAQGAAVAKDLAAAGRDASQALTGAV
jgi:hypothetical protein